MIYIDQYHNRYFVGKLSINKNKNIYTNNEIRETERVGTINFRYNLFWFVNVSVCVIKLQNSSVHFKSMLQRGCLATMSQQDVRPINR